ncbi:MAG TPA: tetratricopeptide repeat protein [Bacillus bacterium]|nr:tetratricopeptide repeat protein [Bacillus sp. (in: firmicutes)]
MNYMSSKTIQNIFYGTVILVIIGLVYTNIAGNKQDKTFKADSEQYEQALQMIQSEAVATGIEMLNELTAKYPEEYALYYQLGLAYSATTDYQKAALNFQKAIDSRPALLQDTQFTFRMGEALFHIGELETSQKYLSMPVPESFQAEKDRLLQEIQKQIKS